MRGRGPVELVVAAACWGSGNVAVKYALRGIPAMTLLLAELLAATAVLWAVVLVRGGFTRPPALGRLALLGLFEPGLTYAAVNLGLLHTTASDASLLSGSESVFVVIFAAIFLGQRLSRYAVAAVCVATVGVAALGGSAPSLATGWGNLLVLLGSMSAAVYVTLASRIAPDSDALTMTAVQFTAGTIVSLPFVAVQWIGSGSLLGSASAPQYWTVAAVAGVIGLALSFLLYNNAISRVRVTSAGMILNLIPLFGLAGAIAVLGESINGWQVVGAVLILGGLALFTLADREPEPPAEPPTEPAPAHDPAPARNPNPTTSTRGTA